MVEAKNMEELNYPKSLNPIYTDNSIVYRKKFNDMMHSYLTARLHCASSEEKAYFSRLSKEDNLIIPDNEVLKSLKSPFDVISASVINKEGKGIMFVEFRSQNEYYKRGVGKSGILLELVGVQLPYDKIPSTLEQIIEGNMLRFSSAADTGLRILSSDMPYLSENKGSLAIAIPKGEQIIAQWDIARHIYRVNDENYTIGKNRKDPQVREYIKKLGEWCCLDSLLFANTSVIYPVHFIYTMTRLESSKDIVTIKKVKNNNLEAISKILNYTPLYHDSPFWDIDKKDHIKRVERLTENLRNIPEIFHLEIHSSKKYLVKDIKRLVLETSQ